MSDIIFRYEDLLERVARLHAELVTEHMREAADSMLTTMRDLMWQLYEIEKFEKE